MWLCDQEEQKSFMLHILHRTQQQLNRPCLREIIRGSNSYFWKPSDNAPHFSAALKGKEGRTSVGEEDLESPILMQVMP